MPLHTIGYTGSDTRSTRSIENRNMQIRIANPRWGDPPRMSESRAWRMIEAGEAVMEGSKIRILSPDERALAGVRTRWWDRRDGSTYRAIAATPRRAR